MDSSQFDGLMAQGLSPREAAAILQLRNLVDAGVVHPASSLNDLTPAQLIEEFEARKRASLLYLAAREA